ncbi:TrmH family RNA methyltransferase [Psychroflexus sp. ALD_RP9]|uniref:TrmH family RNA methyltransferase n=1 Tax=Psychroflexus sp. ALD_RP9 TaxID=2777186 RepID=UPI001A8F7C07|nr:RNA methyltransferase [Psychroflexus sp. ALD_RP9]QSS97490.1 RNA methyltransferase [Psychroflexus sp. ALD_RP9]
MIESLQNQNIKKIQRLQKKTKRRKDDQLIVVEGVREIKIALQNKYQFTEVYVCNTIYDHQLELKGVKIINVSEQVYQKIAYRSTTEGIIGLAKPKQHHLLNLKFKNQKPLILIAEAPEKPGNIGALLRTADAANLDAVIIANPKTDLYNPNIIRSSLGTVFSKQIGIGSTHEIINFLREKKISIYAATLQNSNIYTKEDFTKASAIVVGTESKGLSELWRNAAKQNINIPMQGSIDSMNVSVSAAIIIFEAKRQRDLK